MGSSSSKFRKHLQNGDEYAALQLYYNSSDLRKGLDPNSSYGDTYNHDTPLHYAARHAMKSLLRIFLYELGGNPNKKNCHNETTLHCVCMATNGRNYAVQQRRLECLHLVLQWRGATLQDGEVEKVDLGVQDEKLNTALHYAASSGLRRCVELLVSKSTPLFTENALKQTPCDSAEKCNHNEIALYLESKMVFSNEEENADEMDTLLDEMEAEEGYSGLRAQDLQEAKDQLLVETSDMLRVPLFTAEALLRNHEWSRETLLESWMDNAISCCDKCGVVPPSMLYDDTAPSTSANVTSALEHDDLRTPTHTVPPPIDAGCDICACQIPASDEPVPMSCDHQFCRGCWERYLTVKIQEGDAHNVTCPGFECSKLVPVEIIETLVSRDMARRYLQFDIKAFVESNPSIKWCPYPACGRAVRLPDADNPMSPSFTLGMNDMSSGNDTSHAVDCGNGHIFCWECLGEAHEPASCDNWKLWHQKIVEVKPEELGRTDNETEKSANCLWLVTNSKPCPNCKSPIQKNEGCNHMKCSKCKHDFCWVCLEAWKKHSSATGGYFRCNRYEVVKKVEESTDMLKADAEARNKRLQELNRFVHYYSRFKNHENSYKLEEPLISTAKEKMLVLARAVTDQETANLETKFVEDAVVQLLKARRVLKCSYVYGFYLDDTGYKKPIFEFMQTELEECTETLSEMVARPYLRTPRCKIIQTAHLVQRKRHEFVMAIAKGLVPPDTSPTLKKKRKKFSVELDDDLRKALMASIQDLDPSNPWVKDPSGKHTNVSALLDWPEESDESDSETTVSSCIAKATVTIHEAGTSEEGQGPPSAAGQEVTGGAAAQEEGGAASAAGLGAEEGGGGRETDQEAAENEVGSQAGLEVGSEEEPPPDGEEPVAALGLAPCVRADCGRPRAQNPRTGELHDHCSMKCMKMDRMERVDNGETQPEITELITDYQMDLLRALEMSRLQFLREMGSLRPGSGSRSPRSPRSPSQMLLTPEQTPRTPHSPHSPQALSPRGSSPTLSADLEPIPTIVLSDPPKGRGRGGEREAELDCEPAPVEAGPSQMDDELERVLVLSRMALRDEEQELKLAIELSLQEASSRSASPQPTEHAHGESHDLPVSSASSMACTRQSPGPVKMEDAHSAYSMDYSSIVPRVPNKSIEDLVSESSQEATTVGGGGGGGGTEYLGAYGGGGADQSNRRARSLSQGHISGQGHISHPKKEGQGHISGIQSQSQGHEQRTEGRHWCPRSPRSPRLLRPVTGSNFGIIKDICVTNIVPSETDKTKDFADKDFSQAFSKKYFTDGGEAIFEPRLAPPSSPHSPYGGRSPTRPRSPCSCEAVGSQDPWLRRNSSSAPNRKGSRSPRAASPRRSASSSFSEFDQAPPSRIPPPPPPPLTSSYHGNLNFQGGGYHNNMGRYRRSWDVSSSPSEFSAQRSDWSPAEEGLNTALQNLSDLTRGLTRGESSDPADIVIDSKVLESLLQGAEGYAPSSSSSRRADSPQDEAEGYASAMGAEDTAARTGTEQADAEERLRLLSPSESSPSSARPEPGKDTDPDAVFV